MEFLQSHGQSARGPIDLLCLAAVPKPDVTLQQKYDSWSFLFSKFVFETSLEFDFKKQAQMKDPS